jgi:hypothetical protein
MLAKKFTIWTIAGIISYLSTKWISNLIWNMIASTVVFLIVARYLDRWMEGE